jgi:hypothetical protein
VEWHLGTLEILFPIILPNGVSTLWRSLPHKCIVGAIQNGDFLMLFLLPSLPLSLSSFLTFFFETGFHCIVQAGLKLAILLP